MRHSLLSLSIRIVFIAGACPAFAEPAGDRSFRSADRQPGTSGNSLAEHGGPGLVVIDRNDIDGSGATTLSDLLFAHPMSVWGSFRPASGSSVQAHSEIDLHGIGRTRVLVDGEPAALSPFSGNSANLDLIPLASIERVEILVHPTKATLGSDAAAGIVNIITRRSLTGVTLAYTRGQPRIDGADLESGSASIGVRGDRGEASAVVSFAQRDVAFARDQFGGNVLGNTVFGNNYRVANNASSPIGNYRALPGFDCSGTGTGASGPGDVFYRDVSGRCAYNFNAVSASTPARDISGLTANASIHLPADWSTTMSASVNRLESFGRFAATPADIFVSSGSPNDPVPGDGLGAIVSHRFASAGPRDNTVDETGRDLRLEADGPLSDRVDLSFGLRHLQHQGYELGENYIVTSLAQAAAESGRYLFRDPFAATPATLDGITATISRDAHWQERSAFASADVDLFSMPGGTSTVDVALEWRDADYADRYDSSQSAGLISGTAGASAAGRRTERSLRAEWFLPVHERFDASLAARGTEDDRFGTNHAVSMAMTYRPFAPVTLHAAWGDGFSLPTLDALGQDPSPSAFNVIDRRTCIALGRADCGLNPTVQVDSILFANPLLYPEDNRHWAASIGYKPLDWVDMSVTWHRTRIDHLIAQFSAQALIDRDNNGSVLPAGLVVRRDPNTGALLLVERGYANHGYVDQQAIDWHIGARFDAGRFGAFDTRIDASHLLHVRRGFPVGADSILESDFTGQVTAPDRRALWTTQWTLGDFSVTARSAMIGPQSGPFSDSHVGSFASHDLKVAWHVLEGTTVAIGATNLADKDPPTGSTFTTEPWNRFLYSATGRTPYLNVTHVF